MPNMAQGVFYFMTKKEQIFIQNDEFVTVEPGKPFRLFKWGDIYKGGKKRTISRDNPFHLPHFKPPIKLGSHREETPSGGSIKALENREDGVYAVPELNDEGMSAWEKGSYRYHSPEVIWGGGGYEDPETGKIINGPLIVGVALTHTPHLGEQTALYTYSVEENNMSELAEVVEKNTTIIDKFMSLFEKQMEEEPPNEPEVQVDEFEAIQAERDDLAAKIQMYEAEKAQAELFSAIKAEFDVDEYGAAFKAIADQDGAVEKLAALDEETREWILGQFKALSAQADAVTEELGEDNPLEASTDAFSMAIQEYMTEKDVKYNVAYTEVAKAHPDLYQAYQEGK